MSNRSKLILLYGFLVLTAVAVFFQSQGPSRLKTEHLWTNNSNPDELNALPALTQEKVYSALANVKDPELQLNIHELGLIYEMSIVKRAVNIIMTLTTPNCPFSKTFIQSIKKELLAIPEIETIKLSLTFDPPWTINRLAPEIRDQLIGVDQAPDHLQN